MPGIPSGLIEALRGATRIAVLTGAGVSAESGVPTFRDTQTGLWARFDPEELATPGAFQRNPRLVWEWYTWRRSLIQNAAPNPAHLALVDLEGRVPDFTLITQNVDGLHQRAGSRNVVEIHGNIHRDRCSQEGLVIPPQTEGGELPPRCPQCGGLLRPDVVWFGEALGTETLLLAIQAARAAEVFLSVGTSGVVHPAASLPGYALEAGAVLVEINPAATPLSRTSAYILRGPAGEVLPRLVGETWPEEFRRRNGS